jgi:hypothetical protein
MRRILLNLSVAAFVVAAPIAAHAAAMDVITFTSGGSTYAYTLPNAPTTFTTDGVDYIELTNVGVSVNGGATTMDTVMFLGGGTSIGGGLDDVSPGGDSFANSTGEGLFNNNYTTPTFDIGETGSFEDAFSSKTFTVTVAPQGTPSPTPEPSSLMLLGTGALGLCGAVRRKLFA